MYKTIKYIFLLTFGIAAVPAFTQTQVDTLRREVEVTKAFVPTIEDANKLNSLPEMDQTPQEKPSFNYSIKSQPLFSTFSVTPLKAATIETTPPVQRGYGLVRAGVGNYFRPYGEVFFNNLNSKNSVFGIHAKHLSSFGRINLEGGDRVDAPFMKNDVELFVKHTVQRSILSVSADLDHDAFRYYGYPLNEVPQILKEDDQSYNYFGQKQAFTKGGLHISLNDPGAEIDEQEIGFSFDYHYFGAKTDQREHFVNFSTQLRMPMQVGIGLLDAGIEYTSANNIFIPADSTLGSTAQTLLIAKPAWHIGTPKANLTLGLNAWFIMKRQTDTEAKIAPVIRANWSPVPEVISIYAGLDGNLVSNYYSKIAYENPFVDPEHNLRNSMEKFRFFGGFDGKFSRKTAFKFSAEYTVVADQPLYFLQNEFIENTLAASPLPSYFEIINNTFAVLYDDMNRLKLNAEIFHASSDKLDFLLSMNYFVYKMNTQEEAWNMPDWDATLSIGYKISDQLSVSADVYLVGERKALIMKNGNPLDITADATGPTINSHTLNGAFDLNVKGNYQLTGRFSVFAQLNNFGFQKYQRWLGYPNQSFNFLGGISYAF